jgi:carboxypeptidase T
MRYLYVVLFVVFSQLAQAQNARLKIWLDPISESLLYEMGVEKEHGVHKPGVFYISDFTAAERTQMKTLGIDFEVLIDDITTYYQQRNSIAAKSRDSRASCFEANTDSIVTPSGFDLGNMGGFYTYEEFLEHLDSMVAQYPNLITIRQPIDTFLSHEQRPIYWVKISDNPNVNETEPEVLYTAVHHAREPESLTQLIFYMYYLLENYGSNDEVTHLVNNTEMYFIPMLNPDGYIRNQMTDPSGGGLWRKNRRDNGDGTFGVDLNRNYGHEWGYDNSGSSPTASSETYRGPSPFSEPETQAVKWFAEQHEFDLALNYHAFGNYVIYPWGYIESPLSPDSNAFTAFAESLTADNNYVSGTGYQTVGYATNGDSDDWMYGEQTSKPKIYSMTPEVGNSGDGFWPTASRIEPIAKENLKPNLLLSHFAGNYMVAEETSPYVLPSITGQLSIDVTRLGLKFDVIHELKLTPVSSNITSSATSQTITSIALGETQTINLPYQLSTGISTNEEVVFELEVKLGDYSYSTFITKIYGQSLQPIVATDDITEFNTTGWNTTTEDFTTAPVSFTDSPNTMYDNNSISEIEYRRMFDLTHAVNAYVSFDAKWEIEAGWDYAHVLISEVNENTYQPACGLYSKEGNVYQDQGEPVWDGNQLNWVKEYIDLSDYLGQKVKMKFKFVSDGFVNFDGFYFDDLQLNLLLEPNYNGSVDTGYWDTLGASGLNALKAEDYWTIYPNPASTEVMITSKNNQKAKIVVRDVLGKVVLMQSISGAENLSLLGLESGLFFLEIHSENSVETHRLIKE